MFDLLLIEFASEEKAEGVRELLLAMHSKHPIEPSDVVVAVQDASGRLKLNQLFAPAAQGRNPAAFWIALIGLLCRWPPRQAETYAVGAVPGLLQALAGSEDFRRRAARTLRSGNTALFLLVRSGTTDKVLSSLQGVTAPVLRIGLTETGSGVGS